MGKVYVITRGEYSSYHLVAVFSTRELADLFIKSVKPGGYYDEHEVEEWDLDPLAAELRQGFKAYFGRIDVNGNIVELDSENNYAFEGSTQHSFDMSNNLYMHLMAKDEDHAIKILAERHASVLASGAWPME